MFELFEIAETFTKPIRIWALLLSISLTVGTSNSALANSTDAAHVSAASVNEVMPATVAPHPMGYDSAAEFLLRHLVLHINANDLTTVELDRTAEDIALDRNVLRLYRFFLQQHREKPNAPLSPFNLYVRYTSPEKTEIDLIFEDATKPIGSSALKPESWKSPLDMVNEIAEKISLVLRLGQHHIETVTFDRAQQNHRDILRESEAGRALRIVGVDAPFEAFLLRELHAALDQIGFELKDGFYFGSRVMTRDKVHELDPVAGATLPMNKGKLVKAAVRMRGLTSISDLEVFLVIKSKQETVRFLTDNEIAEQEQRVLKQVRNQLNQRTRRFSFGLKVYISQNDGDAFAEIKDYDFKRRQKEWIASPEQYARFYSQTSAKFRASSCRLIFRAE